jgi:two-component system, NarL family, response regulator LiaR
MIHLAIIDDEPQILTVFQDFISRYSDMKLVSVGFSIDLFLSNYRSKSKIDILFLDIDLNGQSSLQNLPTLIKKLPHTQIIIYTNVENSETLMHALHLGVSGYILKDEPYETLRAKIEIILDGGAVISPRMAKKLITFFADDKNLIKQDLNNPELSSQEIIVLQSLANGLSYDEIAAKMSIATNTVRTYIRRIYKKLEVNNKVEAINKFNNL